MASVGTEKGKGGVIGEINRRLATQKKSKGNSKDEKFEEMSDAELAKQEGRKAIVVQGELPSMETPKLKDVIRAAEAYREARDARMNQLKVELENKTLLLGVMQKHQLRSYSYGGLVVEIVTKDSVKVRVDTDDDGDQE